MWIKLGYKKEFVLSPQGSVFCVSVFFALVFSLFFVNVSIASTPIHSQDQDNKITNEQDTNILNKKLNIKE